MNDWVEWSNELKINFLHGLSLNFDLEFRLLQHPIAFLFELGWHKLKGLQSPELIVVVKNDPFNMLVVLTDILVPLHKLFKHSVGLIVCMVKVVDLREWLNLKSLFDLFYDTCHVTNPDIALTLGLFNSCKLYYQLFLARILMHPFVALIYLLEKRFIWQVCFVFVQLIEESS